MKEQLITEIYHGGYTPIEIPEICIGKTTKDFGSGFYY